jgi:SAM-dependent methyltransferase
MTTTTASEASNDQVRAQVREHYGKVAEAPFAVGCAPGCCAPTKGTSQMLGYSDADLAAVPEGADLGLGCGNPQTLASLRPGERVLDLGSGAGFDCFLAARAVGEGGRVIGVDMTPSMLTKARGNAAKAGVKNVEFRLGEIEHLPVGDGEVDVIMSNCVVNLSPDKEAVFREAFRVLAPNGRVAISDVVALQPLPEALRTQALAISACVGGAASVTDIEAMLARAGFTDVKVVVSEKSRAMIAEWLPGSGAENYVASASIEARRPAVGETPERADASSKKACCGPGCCT